jgi:hypothetical protein
MNASNIIIYLNNFLRFYSFAKVGCYRRRPEGGGVNGSLMKLFHKKLTYVPCSKPQTEPLKERDENTNQ